MEKIIIFVTKAILFLFFLGIDITRSLEWRHGLLFLTTKMDITHPELHWIKFPFVAVLSHRSRSLRGSKLIASRKHLIAAAVQDMCEAKRGIEFKQKRMRVVRFQFQCNKPSIIWHILRLNPFFFCARLSLYWTDHSSFNIFLPTFVPSSQILFPSSNLICSSIHCEHMLRNVDLPAVLGPFVPRTAWGLFTRIGVLPKDPELSLRSVSHTDWIYKHSVMITTLLLLGPQGVLRHGVNWWLRDWLAPRGVLFRCTTSHKDIQRQQEV